MHGEGGAQHLRLTRLPCEREGRAALVQCRRELVAREPNPRAHVPAVPLHEVPARGGDLGEEVVGDDERVVPVASPVRLRHPLRLEPADVREMPEPLRMLARPALQLEARPEVPEVAVEIGEHPAVVRAQRGIDLLDHDDAPLEIAASLGIAGHPSGGRSRQPGNSSAALIASKKPRYSGPGNWRASPALITASKATFSAGVARG